MSADFETCPVGTMARLRRVEKLARNVVVARETSLRDFIAAVNALESFFSPENEADGCRDGIWFVEIGMIDEIFGRCCVCLCHEIGSLQQKQ